jgi:RHS repeat-associated protein
MQLGPNSQISDGLMAAMALLSEKPHQGFVTKKTGLHPASSAPNFRVTLGLQAILIENGVRKTYRARYYNPVTGRFLSRDPKEFEPLKSRNKPVDSRKSHKYLYTGADPVNLVDPKGESYLEYILALSLATGQVMEEEPAPHVEVVVEFMEEIAEQVVEDLAPLLPPEPWIGPPPTPQFPNPEWGGW